MDFRNGLNGLPQQTAPPAMPSRIIRYPNPLTVRTSQGCSPPRGDVLVPWNTITRLLPTQVTAVQSGQNPRMPRVSVHSDSPTGSLAGTATGSSADQTGYCPEAQSGWGNQVGCFPYRFDCAPWLESIDWLRPSQCSRVGGRDESLCLTSTCLFLWSANGARHPLASPLLRRAD